MSTVYGYGIALNMLDESNITFDHLEKAAKLNNEFYIGFLNDVGEYVCDHFDGYDYTTDLNALEFLKENGDVGAYVEMLQDDNIGAYGFDAFIYYLFTSIDKIPVAYFYEPGVSTYILIESRLPWHFDKAHKNVTMEYANQCFKEIIDCFPWREECNPGYYEIELD